MIDNLSKIKVVIPTCVGYEKHLNNCLTSLDYKNHLKDIIIVKGKSLEETIDDHQGIIRINSSKNLFEYLGFYMIYKYLNHPRIINDKYLFIHDTCLSLDSNFFWWKLEKLDAVISELNCFYYLSNKKMSHGQSIGIGGKEFVKTYGQEFDGMSSITKTTAVHFEGPATRGSKNIAFHQHSSLSEEDSQKVGDGDVVYPILKLKKFKGSRFDKIKYMNME